MVIRAQIFKLLRSTRIDSKESIPPSYVSWRAVTANPVPTRFLAPTDCLKIPAQFCWPYGLSTWPRGRRMVKWYTEGSNLSFGIFSNCLDKQPKGWFSLELGIRLNKVLIDHHHFHPLSLSSSSSSSNPYTYFNPKSERKFFCFFWFCNDFRSDSRKWEKFCFKASMGLVVVLLLILCWDIFVSCFIEHIHLQHSGLCILDWSFAVV